MGDDFQRVSSGERLPGFPAAVYNEMLATIAYVRELRANTGGAAKPFYRQPGIVRIKNTTANDRARFDVLGIGQDASDVFPTPTNNLAAFSNGPVLYGEAPAAATHRGQFAILLEPIAAGKIGWAATLGTWPARLNIGTGDDALDYCDVKDADATQLQVDAAGTARILWKESGTGSGKWGVVNLGAGDDLPQFVGITLTEDMGATTAGEASCTVQPTWDPATETYTGSTASQVAVDSKGIFADAVSGAVGLAIRRRGNSRIVYEIIQLSCTPP